MEIPPSRNTRKGKWSSDGWSSDGWSGFQMAKGTHLSRQSKKSTPIPGTALESRLLQKPGSPVSRATGLSEELKGESPDNNWQEVTKENPEGSIVEWPKVESLPNRYRSRKYEKPIPQRMASKRLNRNRNRMSAFFRSRRSTGKPSMLPAASIRTIWRL